MTRIKITNDKPIPPGGKWIITDEEAGKIMEFHSKFPDVRGAVISESIQIENVLDNLVSFAFFRGETYSKNLFKELVLNKEFFTFMQKYKVFRDLNNMGKFPFPIDKKIVSNLCAVVNIRNKFAHGDLEFSGKIPVLVYQNDGEKKDRLDKLYLEEIGTKLYKTKIDLMKIDLEINK